MGATGHSLVAAMKRRVDISDGAALVWAIVLRAFGWPDISRRRCAACKQHSSAFGQGDFSARQFQRRDELASCRTFDQMGERIQNLVAAQRRLLLDISHELRSPLAAFASGQLSWHDTGSKPRGRAGTASKGSRTVETR